MNQASVNTVTDRFNRPLRDLRISVIDRCNLRCTYCMPEQMYGPGFKFLKQNEWLTFEQIVRLAEIFIQLGVRKMRLTGGEPLLRPGLHELVEQLAAMKGLNDLALTTNGLWLAEQALDLKRAGLKRLTVSLDSLNREVFSKMSGGRGNVRRVLDGIREAQDVGFEKIKINMVVQRGVNDHLILDMVRHFKGTGHIVRFIEFMDVGNCNGWTPDQVVPAAEIIRQISREFNLEPVRENYDGEVARRYRFIDGTGEIGVISPVTRPFCGSCTRLRLSADGRLHTCLFSSRGTDLRNLLVNHADDEMLVRTISRLWNHRDDRYSELRQFQQGPTEKKVEMFYIGG